MRYSDRQRIGELCDEFEAGLRAGTILDIDTFLDRVEDDLRDHLCEELVRVQVDFYCTHKTPFETEDFARFGARFVLLAEKVVQDYKSDSSLSPDSAESSPKSGTSPRIVVGGIERYRLLEKIGDGGFGTVWIAEQFMPNRTIAIKLMQPDASLARFDAERQALARLNHPNIAKIYDGGRTDDGTEYIAMELVLFGEAGRPGKSIDLVSYCDLRDLSIERRIELFLDVCRAVMYVHQNAIIHRDLKPDNILVTELDNRPVVKVVDFGIAKPTEGKLTEKTLHTHATAFLGTPVYASPEQRRSVPRSQPADVDVDARSDLYSLGVILYELLVGSLPFDGREVQHASIIELLRLANQHEAMRPSETFRSYDQAKTSEVSKKRGIEPHQFRNHFKNDLDLIVMKSIEKDRNRRYESVSKFVDDLSSYLSGDQITAREPTIWYRTRIQYSRHRVFWLSSAAFVTLLVAGIVGTSIGILRANRFADEANLEKQNAQAKETEATEAKAQISEAKAQISEAKVTLADKESANRNLLRDIIAREELLERQQYQQSISDAQLAHENNEWAAMRKHLNSTSERLRDIEYHLLDDLCPLKRDMKLSQTVFNPVIPELTSALSPDERLLATLTLRGLSVYRIHDEICIHHLPPTGSESSVWMPIELRFSTSGNRLLAILVEFKDLTEPTRDVRICAWDTSNWEQPVVDHVITYENSPSRLKGAIVGNEIKVFGGVLRDENTHESIECINFTNAPILDISPDGSRAILEVGVGDQQRLQTWNYALLDTESREVIAEVQGASSMVFEWGGMDVMAYLPELSDHDDSGRTSAKVRRFDAKTGAVLEDVSMPWNGTLLAVGKNATSVVAIGHDHTNGPPKTCVLRHSGDGYQESYPLADSFGGPRYWIVDSDELLVLTAGSYLSSLTVSGDIGWSPLRREDVAEARFEDEIEVELVVDKTLRIRHFGDEEWFEVDSNKGLRAIAAWHGKDAILGVSRDGQIISFHYRDSNVQTRVVAQTLGDGSAVMDIAHDPITDRLIIGWASGRIEVWQCSNWTLEQQNTLEGVGITSIATTPNSKRIVCLTQDVRSHMLGSQARLTIVDSGSLRPIASLEIPSTKSPPHGFAVGRNGNAVAIWYGVPYNFSAAKLGQPNTTWIVMGNPILSNPHSLPQGLDWPTEQIPLPLLPSDNIEDFQTPPRLYNPAYPEDGDEIDPASFFIEPGDLQRKNWPWMIPRLPSDSPRGTDDK